MVNANGRPRVSIVMPCRNEAAYIGPCLDSVLATDYPLDRLEVLNLVTDAGDLDLSFTPTGTRGFGDLNGQAVRMLPFGIPTEVASLADVIRSKEAAGRLKDLAALPTLRRMLEAEEDERRG